MAGPLRIEYERAFYHVTSRGNEPRKIFCARSDYERFKSYPLDPQDKYGYLLHCYILMANHYHFLIETPKGNLQKVMHHINGSYTGYINRRRNRSGHLFQRRYKAILIDRDNYLLELSCYIHLNSVRAGIVEKPEAYPYSYKSFIARNREDIVFRDLILRITSKGGRDGRRSYKLLVERGIREAAQNPLEEVYGGSILGGKTFIKEALGRLKDAIEGN
jgi:REP element-mobilizing transposase RayT